MLRTRLSFVGALLLAVTLLSACGFGGESYPIFVAKGETAVYTSKDEFIEDFFSSLEAAENQTVAEPEEITPAETETTGIAIPSTAVDEESLTVYWVSGGEVWHLTDKCSSLSRSKSILSGSIEDAILAGKERVCKKCGK